MFLEPFQYVLGKDTAVHASQLCHYKPDSLTMWQRWTSYIIRKKKGLRWNALGVPC